MTHRTILLSDTLHVNMVKLPEPLPSSATHLTTWIQSFFVGDRLNKGKLRTFVFEQLTNHSQRLEQSLTHPSKRTHWQDLHDLLSSTDATAIPGYERLQKIPDTVAFWLREAVESPQRFEFFVITKATELSTGDQHNDYYHALMIRHDQLLSVVSVLTDAVGAVEWLAQADVATCNQSPALAFFVNEDLETRIYSLAQACFEVRQQKGWV